MQTEPARGATPHLAVMPGTSWSYSKLTTFTECRWRWLRIYVYGEFEGDSRPSAIGRLTHLALGLLVRWHAEGRSDGDGAAIATAMAEAYEAEPAAAAMAGDAEAWSEITELVSAGILHLPDPEPGASVSVERELRLELQPAVVGASVGSRPDLLTATLDVCLEQRGAIRIVDWKTDRRQYAISEKRQLPLYGSIARRIFRRPVAAELRFLRSRGEPVRPRGDEDWPNLMDAAARWAVATIRAVRAAAAEGEAAFKPSPGPQCRYCHLRTKCPALQGIGGKAPGVGEREGPTTSAGAPAALDRPAESWTAPEAAEVGEYLLVLSSAQERVRDLLRAYAREHGPVQVHGGLWSLDPRSKTVWTDLDGAMDVLRAIGADLGGILTLSAEGMRPLLAKPAIRARLLPFFESKAAGAVLAFHAETSGGAGRRSEMRAGASPAADAARAAVVSGA